MRETNFGKSPDEFRKEILCDFELTADLRSHYTKRSSKPSVTYDDMQRGAMNPVKFIGDMEKVIAQGSVFIGTGGSAKRISDMADRHLFYATRLVMRVAWNEASCLDEFKSCLNRRGIELLKRELRDRNMPLGNTNFSPMWNDPQKWLNIEYSET